MEKNYTILISILFVLTAIFPLYDQAFAYIGPGAGFAVLSSVLMIFIAFFLAIVNLISWPLRYLLRIIRGQNAYKHAVVDRVIVVGLDGQDVDLTERFMAEGKLPNFKKLKETGHFSPLGTTFPAISPVAWSSFQTGVNPGKHNIFDFLSPDWKTYLPTLSSALIGNVTKHISLGKYQIPIGKPSLKLLRKSKAFWNILGDNGIFTTVLRVPITFPPEKGQGLMLSAMCVPDLRGSQGSFTYFTTQSKEDRVHTGGTQISAELKNGQFISSIPGPTNPLSKKHEELKIPFTISRNGESDSAVLEIDGQAINLKNGEYSDWVKIVFKPGLGIKVNGICRFLLKSVDPELELYMTPINIDPDKPALPISNPPYYATYLAKLQGSFATLGLAEDTWALNERVIDEGQFLKQAWDIHNERETMFFSALDRLDKGLLVCVFDSTDRIQHTFMRYLHDDHPANKGRDTEVHKNAIEDLYKRADDLIGRVMAKIDDKTALFVVSDHGFKPFKRGVNLNAWLHNNGYLHLKEGANGREWFEGVDWSKTKAYALGLAGIFLNRKGREGQGIVSNKETDGLKKELISKLGGLRDEDWDDVAINKVFDSSEVMSGPYLKSAPDLIVGYKPGYRASWASVTGTVNEDIFTDNVKAWSGDHCMDPRAVPGIIFSNKKIACESPTLTDLAPTILKLFGVQPPVYMDGVDLMQSSEKSD